MVARKESVVAKIVSVTEANLTETIGIAVDGKGNEGNTYSLRVRAIQDDGVVVMDRVHPISSDPNLRLSINPDIMNTFTLGGFPGDLDLWLSDETRMHNPADIFIELVREAQGKRPAQVTQLWPIFEAQGL